MKRDILDYLGNKIGEMNLPDNTSEEVWAEKLAVYAQAPSSVNISQKINGVIVTAADFGKQLIIEFGTRNVLACKSEAEIDSILDNPIMLKIGFGLQSGSLKYAKRKVEEIEPFAGVTQEDKDWLLGRLNEFLGS